MRIRPGITISIQDVGESFWEQELTLDMGFFSEEITLEQLYQLFKERLKGEDDDTEEEEDTESEGAV
jgi:hypothetical protein